MVWNSVERVLWTPHAQEIFALSVEDICQTCIAESVEVFPY